VRLDGERKIYERDADSGYRIRFHFCPACGTTLYWEGDRNPAVCGVAVGAFDTSAFPPPSDSIWEESMLALASLSYFDGRENGPAGRLEARAIGADFLGFLRPSRAVMPPISRANGH
jgi:hypothetical protein